MTAEIAILNKSAVALATDSAVTISSGNSHQKVFDSADKLFELSCEQPIGVMIYNGMQFSGIPLPDVIKEFRSRRDTFKTIDEASRRFLSFLNDLGKSAPDSEKVNLIEGIVSPLLDLIESRFQAGLRRAFETRKADEADFDLAYLKLINMTVSTFEKVADAKGKGRFFGTDKAPRLSKVEVESIQGIVSRRFSYFAEDVNVRIVNLAKKFIYADALSNNKTGIVISGFGSSERFPCLVSVEVEGVVGGRLKFQESSRCEINRNGSRAFIRPFAQKEMVERFLYGLDDEIQKEIIKFCKETVGGISKEIMDRLDFLVEGSQEAMRESIANAENAFLQNLKDRAFKLIESRSRGEIEDMIQFMPKPELAKMAEALIDLTSMKRKVTVGVETVGGPVDVAVISKAEGFVWVKRKHYFPPDLNARYFQRINASNANQGR